MVARELEKAGVPKERLIIEAMGERFASSEAAPTTRPSSAASRSGSNRARRSPAIDGWTDERGAGGATVRIAPLPPQRFLSLGNTRDHRTEVHEQQIVDFAQPCGVKPRHPRPTVLIAGTPRQSVTNYFTDATQQFFAGRWSSTPGKWRIRYTESEFCCLTEGRVVLENCAGRALGIRPGGRVS